jgi:hypothetical protein
LRVHAKSPEQNADAKNKQDGRAPLLVCRKAELGPVHNEDHDADRHQGGQSAEADWPNRNRGKGQNDDQITKQHRRHDPRGLREPHPKARQGGEEHREEKQIRRADVGLGGCLGGSYGRYRRLDFRQGVGHGCQHLGTRSLGLVNESVGRKNEPDVKNGQENSQRNQKVFVAQD